MDAQKSAENEAKANLELEKDKLRNETASKLDVAQLAVDLLSLGRTWSEHFNEWSISQEAALDNHRKATKEDISRLEREMGEMQKELSNRIDQLTQAVEMLSKRLPGC
ncbi:MAG: hypothetical protein M1305_07355 [Candidatus Marsarchaeota archaeon]|nr:hypothetical protein [Candidatus Marsarchaeota archaeon]